MLKYEELIRTPEYWLEVIQNELFRQVHSFMEKENLNQSQLAEKLGVTKGYISQILNGNSNFTLKKLTELTSALGIVPMINYKRFDEFLSEKSVYIDSSLLTVKSQNKNVIVANKVEGKVIKFVSNSDEISDYKCVSGF
jgi:transcriptional regulator with XRE-family HTH domain